MLKAKVLPCGHDVMCLCKSRSWVVFITAVITLLTKHLKLDRLLRDCEKDFWDDPKKCFVLQKRANYKKWRIEKWKWQVKDFGWNKHESLSDAFSPLKMATIKIAGNRWHFFRLTYQDWMTSWALHGESLNCSYEVPPSDWMKHSVKQKSPDESLLVCVQPNSLNSFDSCCVCWWLTRVEKDCAIPSQRTSLPPPLLLLCGKYLL